MELDGAWGILFGQIFSLTNAISGQQATGPVTVSCSNSYCVLLSFAAALAEASEHFLLLLERSPKEVIGTTCIFADVVLVFVFPGSGGSLFKPNPNRAAPACCFTL